MIARLCTISGHVHGVGFRYWVEREAVRLGVVGWVRNVAHGVDALVQGDEDAVNTIVEGLHDGPGGARVLSVEISEVAPEPLLESFEIRF